MTETEQLAVEITTASGIFEGHENSVFAVAVFPNRRRMVTASYDKTLRLWDLEAGAVLKKMEGHSSGVISVAVSRDGQFIASGDLGGEVIAWNGDGESLIKPVEIHSQPIYSLDFSPDSTVLASGSFHTTSVLWDTKTWQLQGNPINCGAGINCVRYSPSGEYLAIATTANIQIWNPGKRECIAKFQGHTAFDGAHNVSLAWTPDGKQLASSGIDRDPTIRIWDSSTWKQVGEPWKGHTDVVWMIVLNPTGTLLASASKDYQVRLWRLSDQRTIAIFKHTNPVYRVTFSTDGKHILSGGKHKMISKWAVPLPEDILQDHVSHDVSQEDSPKEQVADNVGSHSWPVFLEKAFDTQTQNLCQRYISTSEAEGAIQATIKAQLDDAPQHLINTSTGHLCDREGQFDAFKASTEYKELLSSILVHIDLQMERIQNVVATYFRYVMLSHRWEGKEPLQRDIQGKVVYDLDPVGGIPKLQSFCRTAYDMGYRWTWIDTCCIDQTNNVEVQQSVNSMFIWYRHSALTIIYLSDVPPSSQPGALENRAWNTRGWTVQEFLAPKFVLFYQKDWSLYLDDRSSNHKDSLAIMQEMGNATGINAQALVAFRPGMRDAREKLQWVSTRVTTWQEDIAYSLFGIFGVNLPVIYGEKKQNALGRLLQEVVAQSGDISALDWVGQSSEFNSCLPADITSYKTSSYTLSSLPEDDIQASISSLRHVVAMDLALKLYTLLENLGAPRFANCRLHLSCIVFPVTEVILRPIEHMENYFTYEVRADGLRDLNIITVDRLPQLSPGRPARRSFLLVRPWDHRLLELPDYADDMKSLDSFSLHGSPGGQGPVDSESCERAMRLIVRLRQPFSAFLLVQQRGGEYKRIASDDNIITQVEDVDYGHGMMDVRTLEIL